MISKLLSLTLAVFYLVYAFIDSGKNYEQTYPVLIVFVPVIFVWYAEAIGDFASGSFGRIPNKPTPTYAITAAGWFFLLLPIFIAVLRAVGLISETSS